MEIARLKARLLAITSPGVHTRPASSRTSKPDAPSPHRRGKTPPVDTFSVEVQEKQWDGWFITFERIAK